MFDDIGRVRFELSKGTKGNDKDNRAFSKDVEKAIVAVTDWEPAGGWPADADGLPAAIDGSIYDQKVDACP